MSQLQRAHVTTQKRRRRHLRQISRAYRRVSVFRHISPREDFARMVALVAAVSLTVLCHLVTNHDTSSSFLLWFYCLVVLTAIAAHQTALVWSRRPWSYVSLVDDLLARYDPIDVFAYQTLQEQARSLGSVAKADVLSWLAAEGYAVNVATFHQSPETREFLDKRVSIAPDQPRARPERG